MPPVSQKMLQALALRIEDQEAKLTAAHIELRNSVNRADGETDTDELELLEIYINFLSDIISQCEAKIKKMKVTFEKARESRVTGSLQ
jgi:hypothetical protein